MKASLDCMFPKKPFGVEVPRVSFSSFGFSVHALNVKQTATSTKKMLALNRKNVVLALLKWFVIAELPALNQFSA